MLKEGIGKDISHTHFRNLSSEDGRWWSPDPLAAKYPGKSPYISMSNNPIIRVDPIGDDDFQVNRKGEISLINKTDDENDKLYSLDDDDNVNKNNFIEVNKGILDNKETKQNSSGNNYDLLTVKNDDEAKTLFEFLAQNSNVEWSRIVVSKENENEINFLTTSHQFDRESGSSHMFENKLRFDYKIRGHVHSHLTNPYPSGIDGPINFEESYGDIYNIKWLRIYTNSKRATFYIYLPKNELYLKYDENTTIDEFNKLLKEFNITPKDVK